MKQRVKTGMNMPLALLFIRQLGHLKRAFALAGVEKRKYPRVPISIRVTRVTTGSFSFFHAHNISMGGMFIKSVEPLPLGTELHLRFSLFQERGEIEVRGVVVWIRIFESEQEQVPGMGIQFTAVSPETRREIKEFVEMRL